MGKTTHQNEQHDESALSPTSRKTLRQLRAQLYAHGEKDNVIDEYGG